MRFLNKEGLAHLWAKIIDGLNTKVDKITGKELSTNDYTDDDKTKVSYLSNVTSDVQAQINDIKNSGGTVSPAQQDTGVPGTLSIYKSNGFRTYGANGQLLLCPASPEGEPLNTSTVDEINSKENRNKALTPLYLDYAVTTATHQYMGDDYHMDVTWKPVKYTPSSNYYSFDGRQPVSYDAVKNYVDKKADDAYTLSHEELLATNKVLEETEKNLTQKITESNREPFFETIGVWRWEDIDMRLDPSVNPAVQSDGRIDGTLEHTLSNGWTIIKTNPDINNINRVAKYTFPNGKAYKKVIAMMSFDPNYIPEGYITDLERSRGFKEGAAYGQKTAGEPVYSDIYFLGDMGGYTTLLNVDTHCKDKQGFVRVLDEKINGLWTLARTQTVESSGSRADLRHYQSGFYGSYDIETPVYHEDPNRPHHLGSYERINAFEFQTPLPWYYDETSTTNKYNLNNLRGYLCLYGVPEEDPETLYGKKFYNITMANNTDYTVFNRTKQYADGIVSTTIANCKKENINITITTASGTTIIPEIITHGDPGHSGEDVYYTYVRFNMPNEDITITINSNEDYSLTWDISPDAYSLANDPIILEGVESGGYTRPDEDGNLTDYRDKGFSPGDEVRLYAWMMDGYTASVKVNGNVVEAGSEDLHFFYFTLPDGPVHIEINVNGTATLPTYSIYWVDNAPYNKFRHLEIDNMNYTTSDVEPFTTIEFDVEPVLQDGHGINCYATVTGDYTGSTYFSENMGDLDYYGRFEMPEENVTVTLEDL